MPSGMSIQRCVLYSCSTIFMGKTGAHASGGTAPSGLIKGGTFRSAAKLYHCLGISFSERTIFRVFVIVLVFKKHIHAIVLYIANIIIQQIYANFWKKNIGRGSK